MFFDNDQRAAFGVIADLMNSSTERGDVEGLDDPKAVDQIARDNKLSYHPSHSRSEMVALRVLRSRLEEFRRMASLKEAMELVNEMLRSAGSIPQLAAHTGNEEPHLHYTMDDATFSSKVEALVAMGLAKLIVSDSLGRFRECEGDGCRKVFIDVSKNGSRRYCSSQTCGNRLHAARYRSRRNGSTEEMLTL